jgi:P-type Ca2+ transporter type 2B
MNEEVKTVEKSGLILIGILGIMDVIRSEVPRSVAQCVEAGIIVRMVTGDNIVTARAIAKLCNILNVQEAADEACCMEGPAFYEAMGGLVCAKCKKATPGDCTCDEKDKLDNERVRNMNKFKAIAPKLKVMARSRPEDKYLMVTGLRNCDEVVAVTGDGTNDAPALSKADVGFGMGVTGT